MSSFFHMMRLLFFTLLWMMPLASHAAWANWFGIGTDKSEHAVQLDDDSLVSGLRQVLEQSSDQAANLLGRPDGYRLNPRVAIGLPPGLHNVEQDLRRFGMDRYIDDLVYDMNRAAEAAVPDAKTLLLADIQNLTIDDPGSIVRGPDDAATAYLRTHTQTSLVASLRPVIARTTEVSGATAAYKELLRKGSYFGKSAEDTNLDIDDYIARRMIDGMFITMADEEHRIRHNPRARSTQLMKQMFQ
ncbi:MAG: DUF4197 domain-containing protein [Acidiferrobacterales bacterium]